MIAQCQDSFDIGINTLKQQAGSLDEMKAELSSVLQSGDKIGRASCRERV